MSDVTDYRDLLGRYMEASSAFVSNIPNDVIEESDEASEALVEMTQIALEALLMRVKEL